MFLSVTSEEFVVHTICTIERISTYPPHTIPKYTQTLHVWHIAPRRVKNVLGALSGPSMPASPEVSKIPGTSTATQAGDVGRCVRTDVRPVELLGENRCKNGCSVEGRQVGRPIVSCRGNLGVRLQLVENEPSSHLQSLC